MTAAVNGDAGGRAQSPDLLGFLFDDFESSTAAASRFVYCELHVVIYMSLINRRSWQRHLYTVYYFM